jgi:competence protein ComEC
MAAMSAAPPVTAPPVRTAVMLPPLLPICAAILLGAAFGPTHPDVWRIVLSFAGVAVVLALFARTEVAWVGALTLLGLALGLWRATPAPTHAVQWPTAPVDAVRGTVTTWPVARGELVRATMEIAAARTDAGWEPAQATVRALLPAYPVIGRGDRIVVGGSPALQAASGADADGSLYGQWLRIEAVDGSASADRWRHALQVRLIAGIEEHVRAPEAGFAAGVLLGSHSTVDDATLANLNATGTTQHIVISGWNIALIVGVLAAVGRTMGVRRRGVWLGTSLTGIAAYTFLVGADASVVRAAIMGAGGLIAPALGRRADPIVWLGIAMAAMALHDPGVVTNLSFLLSCAATFGVLVVAPALARGARRFRIADRCGGVTEVLAIAVAAQIMTEPLILHQFGRVSLISPLANVIVEPLVPAIMACAALTALLSLVHLGALASIAGVCTAIPAWLFLKIVTVAAALPGASLTLPQPGVLLTLLFYAVPAAIVSAIVFVRPALRAPHPSCSLREAAAGALGFTLVAALSIGLVVWRG